MTMYGVNRSKYKDERFIEIKKIISALGVELDKLYSKKKVLYTLYNDTVNIVDLDKQIKLLEEVVAVYKKDIGEEESKNIDEITDDLLSMFKSYLKDKL